MSSAVHSLLPDGGGAPPRTPTPTPLLNFSAVATGVLPAPTAALLLCHHCCSALGQEALGTGRRGPESQAEQGGQKGSAFWRCAGPYRAQRECSCSSCSRQLGTEHAQPSLKARRGPSCLLLPQASGCGVACSFEPTCAFGLKWGAPSTALHWAGGGVVAPPCSCAHEAAVSTGLCLPSLAFPVLKPSHVPCRRSQGHKTRGVQEAQCPGECWFGVEWGLWEETEARTQGPRDRSPSTGREEMSLSQRTANSPGPEAS